jgi:hypothetical protein
MYVFTCGIGHFVMQVVAVNLFGQVGFSPLTGFEGIGIPIWPEVRPGLTWPGRFVLDGSVGDFEGFADRWKQILPIRSA